jgi:hypothetical protein
MSTVRIAKATAERIAGVREDLPHGEHVLWQGRPDWRSLARHAFHVRPVAAYFVLIAAAAGISAQAEGRSATAALLPAGLGLLACLLLCFLAWLSSRTTIYAITTGRVFLRIGMALPIFIDLPLHRIESANLALLQDGCGDLPLALESGSRLAYLHLWPHARPWRLQRPEPMMRSIPEAESVARILAQALGAAHERAGARAAAPVPAQEPDGAHGVGVAA